MWIHCYSKLVIHNENIYYSFLFENRFILLILCQGEVFNNTFEGTGSILKAMNNPEATKIGVTRVVESF